MTSWITLIANASAAAEIGSISEEQLWFQDLSYDSSTSLVLCFSWDIDGLCPPHGTWAWDPVLHTTAHQLPRIKLFMYWRSWFPWDVAFSWDLWNQALERSVKGPWASYHPESAKFCPLPGSTLFRFSVFSWSKISLFFHPKWGLTNPTKPICFGPAPFRQRTPGFFRRHDDEDNT
jgi:hypothetical protein